MIEIVENFLNKTEANYVEQYLKDSPWFICPIGTTSAVKFFKNQTEDTKEYMQFVHPFLDDSGKLKDSNDKDFVNFFTGKLKNVDQFYRMKANLQTQCSFSNEEFHNTIHVDRPDDLDFKAAIYYVNETDGDTYFFDNDKNLLETITPKKGRLVLFDGNTLHTSRHPKYAETRQVININFK